MPQAIAGALVSAFGSAAFGWGAAYTIAYTVVIAGTVEYNKAQRRKAEARARAAANASAKDREVMIRSAVAPRRIIYGRDRVSGPIVYMESTGDKSQYLHLVVALAAHECDAIETIFFNEVALPTEDGSGYITSGEFHKGGSTAQTVHSGTTNGSGSITLPHNALSIVAAFSETGTGENYSQTQHSYTHTAGSNTVTGLPASTQVTIGYTYEDGAKSVVRIKRHLGSPTQTADADLVSESGGNWTSDHRGRGICYLYVRLEYDQEIFGGVGIPNISAVVRGKKVHDPRTATTAWSDNAALCIADWLRSAEGMRAASAEVPDSEISAAANICDETVTLNLAGTETQKRYTINSSWTSEQSPRDVLADMCQCMGGRAVWTQGRWLVRPGAYRTPTVTITADMLAGPISIAPRASRSELFNAVRVLHRDAAQQYAEVQAPLVLNSGYEADDGGVRIVRQIDLPTLADTYRAQRIGKLELERARQAVTVKLACNLKAYDLAPSDTVLLTLATYGWAAKAFEVLERTLTREGTIQYTLRETAAGVYDWAWGEATIGDLAPDTNLPNPFGLPAILQNLAADEDAIRLADGTIITQAVVTWDASESPFVANGGSIQYQTAKVGTPWGTGSLPGDATTVTLGPLQVGVAYVFRARAINASGRAGDWAHIGLVAQGLAAPPDDVTGLDYEIKPGQVWITWDPCEEADYAATELRYDGTGWDDATFLWRGAGSDYQHPRPPNGTYTVRAKHIDTSGTYSANAASISVTVDDSIDSAAADSVFVEYSVNGLGSWHTTFTAGDEWARWKVGIAGTWTAAFRIVGEAGASGGWKEFRFRRAATKPATPTGDNPAGWYDAPPAADGNPLWASLADKDADGHVIGVWSDPVRIDGADGDKTATVYIYQRKATTPAKPSATVTYTFATATPAGMNNGWSAAIPAGTDPLWVTVATALATASAVADTIASGEWATPVVMAQDGVNTAALYIYRRTTSNSPPGKPSATATYTFSPPGLAGLNNGWTATVPGSGGAYLWVSTATALATGNTDTIAPSEWADPTLMAQDGAAGTGTQGASARRAYALFSGNPSVTGSTIVRAGDVLPLSNSWSPTSSTAWTATTQTPASGQALFQSDGIYDPSANTTTWQVPYLSNFKVGNLAALSAEVDGTQSLSIPDPGSASPAYTRSAALSVNGSLAANVGVYSRSNSATSPAMYGVNLSASSGASGLYGYGPMGVRGYASASSGYGVRGEANGGAGGAGVSGHGAGNSDGVLATWAGFGGSSGVALRSLGSTVLDGPTTVTGQITITASGVPPFVLTSAANVPNLNADLLDGYHASSFQFALGYTPVQQGSGPSQTGNTVKIGWSAGAMLRVAVDATDFGSTWPIHIGGGAAKLNATVSAGSAATTGSATANFPGNNKPGSATTVQWIPWTHNGVAGYIPFWT